MHLFLKNLLFTVLVPGAVAVYIPLWLAAERLPAPGIAHTVGVVLVVAGAAIYGWCLWDFATFGRGTPAPIDAPKKLVVRGLYRYSRNPMYVGVLTVVLGWVALFRVEALVLYAVVVGALFHLRVVLYEEPHLASEFGGQYTAYCSQVPRWLPRPGGAGTPNPSDGR